jgi:hypothetical protein
LSRLSSRQEARTHPKFVDGASNMSVKAELGWPKMLGAATAAKVRLIVWCKSCGHQVWSPIPPRWLIETAPAPASSIGARTRAHPHQDLPKPGAWVLVRSQHDAVNPCNHRGRTHGVRGCDGDDFDARVTRRIKY